MSDPLSPIFHPPQSAYFNLSRASVRASNNSCLSTGGKFEDGVVAERGEDRLLIGTIGAK